MTHHKPWGDQTHSKSRLQAGNWAILTLVLESRLSYFSIGPCFTRQIREVFQAPLLNLGCKTALPSQNLLLSLIPAANLYGSTTS